VVPFPNLQLIGTAGDKFCYILGIYELTPFLLPHNNCIASPAGHFILDTTSPAGDLDTTLPLVDSSNISTFTDHETSSFAVGGMGTKSTTRTVPSGLGSGAVTGLVTAVVLLLVVLMATIITITLVVLWKRTYPALSSSVAFGELFVNRTLNVCALICVEV